MKKSIETKATEYPKNFLDHATRSGSALKVTTAKAEGLYPIILSDIGKKGTGTVLGHIYQNVLKTEKGKKVIAENFLSAFEKISDFSSAEGKNLSSILPKGYSNFKTLKNRICGEIKNGAIRFFIGVDTKSEIK